MAAMDARRGHNTAFATAPSVLAAIAGLALLAAALHLVIPFNHDEAYFIEGAGRMLDGGRFGLDYGDQNPLHVYWISAIPIWLARQIGARSDVIATIFMATLSAISLIVSDRLIASDRSADFAPRTLLPIAAVIVLFVPGYDFGQREYWMVLMVLPYIIARGRRADGVAVFGPAGILIGVAACFGFSIKPYCLLAPIAIEIWLLFRTRRPLVWISPETLAMGITGLLYFGYVVVYVPAYFGDELPKILLGYWTMENSLPTVLWSAVTLTGPAAIFGWLGYATRRQGEHIPTLATAFAVAGLTFLVGGILQMKPWSYHFLPSIIFLDLAAAILLVGGTARPGADRLRRGALLALVVAACVPSASEIALMFNDKGTAARVERLAAIFRSNAGPNGTVAGFFTSPRDIFPAVLASDTTWGIPIGSEYLIAAAARVDEAPTAKRQAIMAAELDQANRDIAAMRAKKPGVIVIDAGANKLGFGNRKFDYVRWLDAHTDFADVLRHYREIGPVGSFRLFVRK